MSTISPKLFYSYCIQSDASLALSTLGSIPLSSRDPYLYFRNKTGPRRSRGQTPLHAASRAGHAGLVQLLLDSGCDPEVLHGDATALFIASEAGHRAVVDVLLTAGADVHAVTDQHYTPLAIACESGHAHVVEALLAADSDQDYAQIDGASPVFIAAFHGHDGVLERLLAAGADISAPDHTGYLAVEAATMNGHLRVVELLLASQHEEEPEMALLQLAQRESQFEIAAVISAPLPQATVDAYHARQRQLVAHLAALQRDLAERQKRYQPAQQVSSSSIAGFSASADLTPSTMAQLQEEEDDNEKEKEKEKIHPSQVEIEAPFLPLLDKFQVSLESRNALFNTHGLELSTLEHLTFQDLSDALKHNTPPLPTLKLRAFFKALNELLIPIPQPQPILSSSSPIVSSSSSPSSSPIVSSSSSISLDSLQIPIESLTIEPKSFAEGGDGAVFRAQYHGSPVVVKRLFCPDDRLQRELEKWCHFRHPNVLLLLGFSQPHGAQTPVIVMEQMDCSLFDLLRHRAVDLDWKLRLNAAHGIAAGLVYLHVQHQIIHRDIKSLNILVRGGGAEVKIADFGASRGDASVVSRKAGTFRWMAPELYDNHPPSPMVDVYALGVTFNEILTRQVPFLELGSSDMAIMKAVVSGQRPSMAPHHAADQAHTSFPAMVQLIQRCWHQNPCERPSAVEILESITAMLNQSPLQIPPSQSPSQSPSSSLAHTMSPTPVSSTPQHDAATSPAISYGSFQTQQFSYGAPSSPISYGSFQSQQYSYNHPVPPLQPAAPAHSHAPAMPYGAYPAAQFPYAAQQHQYPTAFTQQTGSYDAAPISYGSYQSHNFSYAPQ